MKNVCVCVHVYNGPLRRATSVCMYVCARACHPFMYIPRERTTWLETAFVPPQYVHPPGLLFSSLFKWLIKGINERSNG